MQNEVVLQAPEVVFEEEIDQIGVTMVVEITGIVNLEVRRAGDRAPILLSAKEFALDRHLGPGRGLEVTLHEIDGILAVAHLQEIEGGMSVVPAAKHHPTGSIFKLLPPILSRIHIEAPILQELILLYFANNMLHHSSTPRLLLQEFLHLPKTTHQGPLQDILHMTATISINHLLHFTLQE